MLASSEQTPVVFTACLPLARRGRPLTPKEAALYQHPFNTRQVPVRIFSPHGPVSPTQTAELVPDQQLRAGRGLKILCGVGWRSKQEVPMVCQQTPICQDSTVEEMRALKRKVIGWDHLP